MKAYKSKLIFILCGLLSTPVALAGEMMECSPMQQYVHVQRRLSMDPAANSNKDQMPTQEAGKYDWKTYTFVPYYKIDYATKEIVDNSKAANEVFDRNRIVNNKSGLSYHESVGIYTPTYKITWRRISNRAREFTLLGSDDRKDDIETSFNGQVTGFNLKEDGNLDMIVGTNNRQSSVSNKDKRDLYENYKRAEGDKEHPWKLKFIQTLGNGFEQWKAEGLMHYKENKDLLEQWGIKPSETYLQTLGFYACKRTEVKDIIR
ncbi:MAG: hypothetical protein K0R14_1778 [Burkholderiales bacterium]|jgi:hypothetical protein|nr:hypothetical protein [Burkholderiales bacterium]